MNRSDSSANMIKIISPTNGEITSDSTQPPNGVRMLSQDFEVLAPCRGTIGMIGAQGAKSFEIKIKQEDGVNLKIELRSPGNKDFFASPRFRAGAVLMAGDIILDLPEGEISVELVVENSDHFKVEPKKEVGAHVTAASTVILEVSRKSPEGN